MAHSFTMVASAQELMVASAQELMVASAQELMVASAQELTVFLPPKSSRGALEPNT